MNQLHWIFLSLSLLFTSMVLADNSAPRQILQDYLTAPSERKLESSKQIIDGAYLITLNYTKRAPTIDEASEVEFAESLQASHVFPISHHLPNGMRLPKIEVCFSKRFGKAKSLDSQAWITEMMRPLENGYQLESLSIIMTPTQDALSETYRRSLNSIQAISTQLEQLKSKYPQLRSYSSQAMQIGENKPESWPTFPAIHFEQDIAGYTKAGPQTTSDDWCSLHFSIMPIAGSLF